MFYVYSNVSTGSMPIFSANKTFQNFVFSIHIQNWFATGYWISRSFNVSSFISSSSQVFSHIGIRKNPLEFTEKYPCWSLFLIKLQTSNIQSATFFIKETPVQVFSFELCKMFFKNTFYKEQLCVTAPVSLKVQFLINSCTFHQPQLFLKHFTELKKFGIFRKVLPSGPSLYTFSLKRRKRS